MIEVKFENNEIDKISKLTKALENNNVNYEVYTDFFIDLKVQKTSSSISLVGTISFICGLTVFLLAVYFQFWTIAVDYPINIGGKPLFSLIHSIPIAFELSMLFAGVSAVIAFLYVSRLPFWKEIGRDTEMNIVLIYAPEENNAFIMNTLHKLDMRYIIK